jgi:hypothetical protein
MSKITVELIVSVRVYHSRFQKWFLGKLKQLIKQLIILLDCYSVTSTSTMKLVEVLWHRTYSLWDNDQITLFIDTWHKNKQRSMCPDTVSSLTNRTALDIG